MKDTTRQDRAINALVQRLKLSIKREKERIDIYHRLGRLAVLVQIPLDAPTSLEDLESAKLERIRRREEFNACMKWLEGHRLNALKALAQNASYEAEMANLERYGGKLPKDVVQEWNKAIAQRLATVDTHKPIIDRWLKEDGHFIRFKGLDTVDVVE